MADLVRIRNNQRRSRARRKEYLQELESKFRLCEQTGAEASLEIQCAARVVAEENKRLRLLLHSYGIVDPGLLNTHQSIAAANLDRVLSIRKSCVSVSGERGLDPQPELQQWDPYPPIAPANCPSPSPLPLVSPLYAAAHPPTHQQQQQQQQPYIPTNSASCHSVAAAIRSVRPTLGSELEAQLGCSADGRDCSIPTTRAFDLLDRLSESQNNG